MLFNERNKMIKYKNIQEGTFLSRPNRFLADVEIDGQVERVHVKNTGRMKELFLPGVKVYCRYVASPTRKTKYDLITVDKKGILFNVDSQVPNAVVTQAILEGRVSEIPSFDYFKREYTYGDSRLDLYGEYGDQKCFIEVKGVTYEKDRVAKFPDAPTLRGVKHLYSLMNAVKEGHRACVFLLLQYRGADYFTPQDERDPLFGETIRLAEKEGVEILLYDSIVTKDSITIGKKLDYRF